MIPKFLKEVIFLYTGISYGEYLDTPQCRVSIDNVRMKFSYKYKNYDFEKHEAVTTIDLCSQRLDRLFFHGFEIVWHRCDFFKIGNYVRTCTISGIDPFTGNWSCAVMIGRYTFDNSCKLVAPEIVFDFNPNKVPQDQYTEIFNIDSHGVLTIIDFDRDDFGDPWEEFNRIVWCAQSAPSFASGMVDGYFDSEVPMMFWKLLALYICSNTLSSLPWAIPFGEGEIQVMRKQAAQVLEWYDGMKNVVPTWYQKK